MAASMASVRTARVLPKLVHGLFSPAAAVRRPAVCSRLLGIPGSDPDALYQRLAVRVKGHDSSVLDSYQRFLTLAARELGLRLEKAFEPPKHTHRLTLLKSVHIFKKHRVQYEMRTHCRSVEVSRVTGSSARVYLEYIQRNLPEGVAMEVTKTAIEKIPEHIGKPLWDDSKPEPSGQ